MRYILLLIAMTAGFQACAQTEKARKLFDKASIEAEGREYAKALQTVTKALKEDPKYADAWALKADICAALHDTTKACDAHRHCIAAEPNYQSSYFYYAKYLNEIDRFEEALKYLDLFDGVPAQKGFNPKKDKAADDIIRRAAKLRETIIFNREESKHQAELKLENMGPKINSEMREYWPAMTIDGKYFVFTRLVNGQEDFYISRPSDTGWTKAEMLPGKINTPENEGTVSMTADGRFIFFTVCNQDGFGSCDLFYSYYNATTGMWSKRMNLGKEVNSEHWDCTPAIGPDGKTLIFASSRPGGYGGKDLWVTRFANGKWTIPQNLGPEINTAGNEEAPFLHYDGRTLYFASDGHPGLGDHDLFLSRKDSAGNWTKPVNLGKGINTEKDEVGLYVEYKGERAYFSSDRPGGYGLLDIYSFALAPDKRPGPICYVLGKIKDFETGADLAGKIEVRDLTSNQLLLTDSSFSFFTTLEPGKNYLLNVIRTGYLPYSANFQPTAASVDSPYAVVALMKAIKKDQSIVLNNIFFDVDKFDLKSESVAELNTVLSLMKANPGMVVEISGHTDNTGSAAHNKELSENRAKAVVNYLKNAGIAASRLQFKGYGADQPVADNNTEAGRARNRRIEMRVTAL